MVNLNTRVRTTCDTVFQIGSITKVFTATLTMQLQEQKCLDIDAPLKTYLPEFRVADPRVSRTVTLRQLLSHTSGIDGDFFPNAGRGEDAISRFVDMCAMLPQLFEPGMRMSYCNVGYTLLGRVIEVLTRKTYDEVIRERIFEPLGLDHAMTLPEYALRFRCAVGHMPIPKRKGMWRVTDVPYLTLAHKAAGSTPSMSARNLVAFAGMHLNGGKNRTGNRVLTRRSVTAMQRRQIKLPNHSPLAVSHWGLGWFLCDWQGPKVIGHDGSTMGQNAFLRVLPEKNLAVALLTNGGDSGGLYQEMFRGVFSRLARIHEPEAPEPDAHIQVAADKLAGRYENIVARIDVRKRRGRLVVSVSDKTESSSDPFLKDASLAFINRTTAKVQIGDPMKDRTRLLFSDFDNGPAGFVASGFRVFRRV